MRHVTNCLCFSCMVFKYIKFQPQNNILTFHKWAYNAFHFMYLSIFTFQHFNPWKFYSPNLSTFVGRIVFLLWLFQLKLNFFIFWQHMDLKQFKNNMNEGQQSIGAHQFDCSIVMFWFRIQVDLELAFAWICFKRWQWSNFGRNHKRRCIIGTFVRLKKLQQHTIYFCFLVGAMVFKQVTIKSNCTQHNKKLQLTITNVKTLRPWAISYKFAMEQMKKL
jgi:hypothetical protein